MSYLNESLLSSYAYRQRVVYNESLADTTVFLSHSHKDKELVLGLINYLGAKGIRVYVDWNDTSMPRITNKITASKIKREIKTRTFFWILATSNAMNSKWVPWETGVADQAKSNESIGVIPVADRNGYFEGTEYMQLYRRIEMAQSGDLATFKPNENQGQWLSYFTKHGHKLY